MSGWIQQGTAGLVVGVLAGFVSGLLGVSPGGILVPVTILLTGCEQHVAQAVSLVCQVAPTSLSAIRRYRQNELLTNPRWVLLLLVGFLVGEVAGSLGSSYVSSQALQWIYVGYLVLLEILLVHRARRRGDPNLNVRQSADVPGLGMSAVGLVAGFSSGFMGIGGGLAIVVGLTGILRIRQHQAQAVSLLMSMFPITAPAAFIYWHQGWPIPWILAIAIVFGLFAGNDLGGRVAVRLPAKSLQQALMGLVLFFAAYMALKATGRA